MMFAFTSLLMLSLSAVLYLMVRALPRLVEEPEEKKNFIDRWAHSQLPEKVDATLNGYLLKFLRKLKVFVLRLDNSINRHMQKVKPEDNGKKPAIDFKEIAGNGASTEKPQE